MFKIGKVRRWNAPKRRKARAVTKRRRGRPYSRKTKLHRPLFREGKTGLLVFGRPPRRAVGKVHYHPADGSRGRWLVVNPSKKKKKSGRKKKKSVTRRLLSLLRRDRKAAYSQRRRSLLAERRRRQKARSARHASAASARAAAARLSTAAAKRLAKMRRVALAGKKSAAQARASAQAALRAAAIAARRGKKRERLLELRKARQEDRRARQWEAALRKNEEAEAREMAAAWNEWAALGEAPKAAPAGPVSGPGGLDWNPRRRKNPMRKWKIKRNAKRKSRKNPSLSVVTSRVKGVFTKSFVKDAASGAVGFSVALTGPTFVAGLHPSLRMLNDGPLSLLTSILSGSVVSAVAGMVSGEAAKYSMLGTGIATVLRGVMWLSPETGRKLVPTHALSVSRASAPAPSAPPKSGAGDYVNMSTGAAGMGLMTMDEIIAGEALNRGVGDYVSLVPELSNFNPGSERF